eukprot:4561828-Pyramimonas_sp.AAC.1
MAAPTQGAGLGRCPAGRDLDGPHALQRLDCKAEAHAIDHCCRRGQTLQPRIGSRARAAESVATKKSTSG